jgi:hypothetical protein
MIVFAQYRPGAPEGSVAVMHAAPRTVLRRSAVEVHAAMFMVLPPANEVTGARNVRTSAFNFISTG